MNTTEIKAIAENDYRYALAKERTARAPEWLRDRIIRDCRKAALRRAAKAAVRIECAHLPRVGCDSGRSGHWFLGLGCMGGPYAAWGWWMYAAARRSLALAGYTTKDAIAIARQAACTDTIYFAPSIDGQTPSPPHGSPAMDCHGWDKGDVSIQKWTGWLRSLTNSDAPIGRRMRRWIGACVKVAKKGTERPEMGWWPLISL
jgi:hypothetical protein